jgi:hypothetical protein
MTGKRGRPAKLCKPCVDARLKEYQRAYYQRPETRERRAEKLAARIKAEASE